MICNKCGQEIPPKIVKIVKDISEIEAGVQGKIIDMNINYGKLEITYEETQTEELPP